MTTSEAAPSPDERDDLPQYRYAARLANEIETKWQDLWEAQHTFWAPNPVGALTRAGRRPRASPSSTSSTCSRTRAARGSTSATRSATSAPTSTRGTGGCRATTCSTRWATTRSACRPSSTRCRPGQHPRVTTEANIANMRRQLRALGLGHDPRRGVATTDVAYYRWTQWIFLQIFNSWYDDVADRARPIAELIAEFESGTRAPSSDANPDGLAWSDLDERTRRARRRLVPPRVPRRGDGQLVPRAGHRARERRGHGRRAQRARQPPCVQAPAEAVGARDHVVRRPAHLRSRSRRLARADQGDAAQLDRAQRRRERRRSRSSDTRRRRSRCSPPAPTRCSAPPTWSSRPSIPLVDHIVPNEWPDALFSDELTDIPPRGAASSAPTGRRPRRCASTASSRR